MRRPSRRRQLAPWEEIGYFQLPNVIVTPLTGPVGWTQIAPNSPNRVSLTISSTGSTRLSTDNTIATGAGIAITNTMAPYVVREKDDGNLCTSAWYAVNGGAGTVTVIEVILREWPGDA